MENYCYSAGCRGLISPPLGLLRVVLSYDIIVQNSDLYLSTIRRIRINKHAVSANLALAKC